jgi:hypothetical protein
MTTERYYLDTNALYAFYRDDMASLAKHPKYKNYQDMTGSLVMRRLTSCTATVYVSNLTYLEFLGNLMRHERTQRNGQWELRRSEVNKLKRRLLFY